MTCKIITLCWNIDKILLKSKKIKIQKTCRRGYKKEFKINLYTC